MDDAATVDLIAKHVTDVRRGRESLGREPKVDLSLLFPHKHSSRILLAGVAASTLTRAARTS
jgi:hypothetical protein